MLQKTFLLIASFIVGSLISSLMLTGILSNNLSQGTERVSGAMLNTASASSDGDGGGGDDDQGGRSTLITQGQTLFSRLEWTDYR